MAKTLIDVDEDALAGAARELGTTTKRDTVNEALRLAAGLSERVASYRRLTEALDRGDLGNPEIMKGAWR